VDAAAEARAVEDADSGVADKTDVDKGPKSIVVGEYEGKT
jgi:hypothetical protein